jgi:hypothetical protein
LLRNPGEGIFTCGESVLPAVQDPQQDAGGWEKKLISCHCERSEAIFSQRPKIWRRDYFMSNNGYIPQRAMSIYAHPDDQEFSIGGTLAKWRAGLRHFSHYHQRDSGSNDPSRMAINGTGKTA